MSGALSALRCQGGHERAAMVAHNPLSEHHPCLHESCAVCALPFRQGDVTTVIPLGPGLDIDNQAKALRGAWYSAWGVVAHAACAGIESP